MHLLLKDLAKIRAGIESDGKRKLGYIPFPRLQKAAGRAHAYHIDVGNDGKPQVLCEEMAKMVFREEKRIRQLVDAANARMIFMDIANNFLHAPRRKLCARMDLFLVREQKQKLKRISRKQGLLSALRNLLFIRGKKRLKNRAKPRGIPECGMQNRSAAKAGKPLHDRGRKKTRKIGFINMHERAVRHITNGAVQNAGRNQNGFAFLHLIKSVADEILSLPLLEEKNLEIRMIVHLQHRAFSHAPIHVDSEALNGRIRRILYSHHCQHLLSLPFFFFDCIAKCRHCQRILKTKAQDFYIFCKFNKIFIAF